MDFAAQGAALAVRFNATNCPAPAGITQQIRLSTNFPPNGPPPTPCVIVTPEEGDLEQGNGKRETSSGWKATFYYNESGVLEKDYRDLQAWLGVLIDACKGAVQLGGIVEYASIHHWRLGTFQYGGHDITGIELSVHVEAHESWLATA